MTAAVGKWFGFKAHNRGLKLWKGKIFSGKSSTDIKLNWCWLGLS